MTKRLLAPLAVALLLGVPATAAAKVEKYEGGGIKTEAMSASFFLKDGKALKRLSFRDIPMFCGGGRKYMIDGRRFGEAIELGAKDRFQARGAGDFPTGREVAKVWGKLRTGAGRVRGVLRVTARRDGGATCRSGKQTWRARQA